MSDAVEASSSNPPPLAHNILTPPPPTTISRLIRTKREDMKIFSHRIWDDTPKKETEKTECVRRDISEDWDEYDSFFYNAWLGVEIKPTRFSDPVALRKMGIREDVQRVLKKIGLGTICTKYYDLFPYLVRQFLATTCVYYTNEIIRNVQEGTLTFLIRGVRYRISLRNLCTIYGFDKDKTGTTLSLQYVEIHDYWAKFGNGNYDSKTSM
ncbi:hypothetical protein V5N11_014363 [Cardamine amara subsp. amara]|uniref:Arabidopsis retrotransposon Orf1 C-terminal domain-containing protein n=1 Tax=Cardamine amara subsp. amara TaxID=228776 RepID=A0ABD1A9D6_CARAN